MEKRRKELSNIFKNILKPYKGHCYFQPPPNIKMEYPAVKYEVYQFRNRHADGNPYLQNVAFKVTVIEQDSTIPIATAVSKLSLCEHDRAYNADGLSHNVFIIY